MRTYDLSPLFRSSVGFDRMTRLLESALKVDDAAFVALPSKAKSRGTALEERLPFGIGLRSSRVAADTSLPTGLEANGLGAQEECRTQDHDGWTPGG